MNINLMIIGQILAFSVFVWFSMRFVWPHLSEALDTRRTKIAESLEEAEQGWNTQRMAQEKAVDLLKSAKEQSAEIIAMAEKRATEIVEESKGNAREEGDRILAHVKTQIEQELFRVREDLRHQVSALALEGTEQILKKEMDAKTHKALVKDLVSRL